MSTSNKQKLPYEDCQEVSILENPLAYLKCLQSYYSERRNWEEIVQLEYSIDLFTALSPTNDTLIYSVVEETETLIKSQVFDDENEEYLKLLIHFLYLKGFWYLETGFASYAESECWRLFEISNKIGNEYNQATAYDLLSLIELDRLNLIKAQKYQLESLRIRQKFDKGVETSYNNLGEIQRKIGHFNEAMSNYQKSSELASEKGDLIGEAIAYNNMGIIKTDLGEFDQANEYFLKSQAIYNWINLVDPECVMDYIESLIRSKKQIEALEPLYSLSNEIKNNNWLFSYIELLGRFELAQRNFQRAKIFLDQALVIAEHNNLSSNRIGIRARLIEWHMQIFRLERSYIEIDKAFHYLREAKDICYYLLFPGLHVEIYMLESSLYLAQGEIKKGKSILIKARRLSRQTNNQIQLQAINNSIRKLDEMGSIQEEAHVAESIIEYVNRIGRIARDTI